MGGLRRGRAEEAVVRVPRPLVEQRDGAPHQRVPAEHHRHGRAVRGLDDRARVVSVRLRDPGKREQALEIHCII